jgi:hypothetical protein
MQKIQKQDLSPPLQELVKQTENNVEQVLLHLHALCPDDLPIVKWEGDEWQPDLLNDDIYPQFHRSEDYVQPADTDRQQPAERYEVLWAVPLCGRDQTKHWHDKLGLGNSTAGKVLLFHYEFKVRQADQVLESSLLECFFGMYDGYQGHAGSVSRVFQNNRDNTIPVTSALLVTMVEHVEDLRRHVNIEHRVADVMRHMREHRQQWSG